MEIRKIRPEERDRALGLMSDAFDPSYERIFFLKEEWCLVAVEDGEVIAGCNSDIFDLPNGKKIGYIGWLYTSEKARGQGLASKLSSAMIDLLEEEKCDDILAVIEGDNPSSFKLFAGKMNIMSLPRQLEEFGLGIFKVWKRSAHFLDAGYFVWHRGKGLDLNRGNFHCFILNMIMTAAFLAIFLGLRGDLTTDLFLTPFIFLTFRTLMIKATLGWNGTIFLPWDTYPALSLISSLILPFFIPVPMGVYIKGAGWNAAKMGQKLSTSAMKTLLYELLFFFFTGNLTVVLPVLLLDSLFSFYPFCGFQASRIARGGTRHAVTAKACTLTVVIIYLLAFYVL